MASEKDEKHMLPLKLSLLPNPLDDAVDDDDKTPEYPLKEGSIIMAPFFSLLNSNIKNINTPNTEWHRSVRVSSELDSDYAKLESSPSSIDIETWTSSPPEIKCEKSPYLTSDEPLQLSAGGCDMPDTTANPEMLCFLDNEACGRDGRESLKSGCFSLPSPAKSSEHNSMSTKFNTFTHVLQSSDKSQSVPTMIKANARLQNVEKRQNENVALSAEIKCTSTALSPYSPWTSSAFSSCTSGNNETTVSCYTRSNDVNTHQEVRLDVQQMDCDSDYMRVWNRQLHIFALDLSDKQCGFRQALRHVHTHGQPIQEQYSEGNLSLLLRSLIDLPQSIPLSAVSFNKETYSSFAHKGKTQVRAASGVLCDLPSKTNSDDKNNGSNRMAKEGLTARLKMPKNDESDQIPQLTPHIPTDDQFLLPSSSFDNQPPNLSPIEPLLSTRPFSSNQSPPGAPDILCESNKALNRSLLLPASGNYTGHTSPSTPPACTESLQCVVACCEPSDLTPDESGSGRQPGIHSAFSTTSDPPTYSSTHALSSNTGKSLAKHDTVVEDDKDEVNVEGRKCCFSEIVFHNSSTKSIISTASSPPSIALLGCDDNDTEHSQNRWCSADRTTSHGSDYVMPMIGHLQCEHSRSHDPSEISVKDTTPKEDTLCKASSVQNRKHTDKRTNPGFPGIHMRLECKNSTGNHNNDSNIISRSKYMYANIIGNYSRIPDYETNEENVSGVPTISEYLQASSVSQNNLKNAAGKLQKHNNDILVENKSKCTKEQLASTNSKSKFTFSSHDSAIRAHQNAREHMTREELNAQKVPEACQQPSAGYTPIFSSKTALQNKNCIQPPLTLALEPPCEPIMFPYRSGHIRLHHSSASLGTGTQDGSIRYIQPFEDERAANSLRKLKQWKTIKAQQYDVLKTRVAEINRPTKKQKPDILENIDFGKHLRMVISTNENETLQAENETVDDVTVQDQSETIDKITLQAESETIDNVTLQAESETRDTRTLQAESETRDNIALQAESETRDNRTIQAGSETRDNIALQAESETRDKIALQAESETRDNITLQAESETRDNIVIQAENETRDNRILQDESETRDNRTIRAKSRTRKNRTIQVETEAGDNSTLRAENRTKDKRTIRAKNGTKKKRAIQAESETGYNRPLQTESERSDSRAIRAKSGTRKKRTNQAERETGYNRPLQTESERSDSKAIRAKSRTRKNRTIQGESETGDNRTLLGKNGTRNNITIGAKSGTRKTETVWVESGTREYRAVQAMDSQKQNSVRCPPSIQYISCDEFENGISADCLKAKTPSFTAYQPKTKKNISKELHGKFTCDSLVHWEDCTQNQKKPDSRNAEYSEPVMRGYSHDGGQFLYNWNAQVGSVDETTVSEQRPRSERLQRERITQDKPLDLSQDNNERHSGTAAALASYVKSRHHNLQPSRGPPYGLNPSHGSKLSYSFEHADTPTSRCPSQFANSIAKNINPSSLWSVNHPGHNLQNSPYPPPEVAVSLSSIPLEFRDPVHSGHCSCSSSHTRFSSRDMNSSLTKPSIHRTVSPSTAYTPENIYGTPDTIPRANCTPTRNHYPFTVPFSTHSLPPQSCYLGANPTSRIEQLPSVGYRYVNVTPAINYGLSSSRTTSFVNTTDKPLEYRRLWPHAQSKHCSTIRALLESKENGRKLHNFNSHPIKKTRTHHYPIHAKAPHATATSLNTVYQDSSFDSKTFQTPAVSSGQHSVVRTCSAPREEEVYECSAPTTNSITYLSSPEMMHSLPPHSSYTIYPRLSGLHHSLEKLEAHSHLFTQSEAPHSSNPLYRESETSEIFYNDNVSRFNFPDSRIQNEGVCPSLSADRTLESSPETFLNDPVNDADIQINATGRLQNNLMIDLTDSKDEYSEVVSISSNDTVEETRYPFTSSTSQDKISESAEWSNIDPTTHWSKSFTRNRHADVSACGSFLPTNRAKDLEHHSVHSSFTQEGFPYTRHLTYGNPHTVSSLLSTGDRMEDCYVDEEEDAAVSYGIRYMDCQSNTPPQSCTTNSSDLSSPRLLNNILHTEPSTARNIFETADAFSEKEHCTVSRPHSLEQLYEEERDDTFQTTRKVDYGHYNLSIVSPTKTSLAEKIKLVMGQRHSAPAEEMLQAPGLRGQQTADYMVPVHSPFDQASTTSRTLVESSAQGEILPDSSNNLGIANLTSPFNVRQLPSSQSMEQPQEEFYQERIYQIRTHIKGNADFWKDQKEHAEDLANHKPKQVSKRRKLNPKKASTHENCRIHGITGEEKQNLVSETKPRGGKKRTQKETRAKRSRKMTDVQVMSLSEETPDFQSPVPEGSYGQESPYHTDIHPHAHGPTSISYVVLDDVHRNDTIPSEPFQWKMMRSPRSCSTLDTGVQLHAPSFSKPQETVYTVTGTILSPRGTGNVNRLTDNDESMKGRPEPRSHEEMNTSPIIYPHSTQMFSGPNHNSSSFLNSPQTGSYSIQSPPSNFIRLNQNCVSENNISIPQTHNRPGCDEHYNIHSGGKGHSEGSYGQCDSPLENLQDGISSNSETHILSKDCWVSEPPLNTIRESVEGCGKSVEGMYPHLQTLVQDHYLHQMCQLNNQERFPYHDTKDHGFEMAFAVDHSCEKRTTLGSRVMIREDISVPGENCK